MKTIYVALAAVSALAAAAPAAAQYSRHEHDRESVTESRLDELQVRIDAAARAGTISAGEARMMRDRLWRLRALGRDYSVNGISNWERGDLAMRMNDLSARIPAAAGQDYGYGYGYGYGRDWSDRYLYGYDDRYDRDGDGYADWADRDGNGYDDRLDRDGNGYDDRFDRDGDGLDDRGPYAAAPLGPDHYGVGGPEYDVPSAGSLGVGDIAPLNLGLVPPEYRSQYPDGNGVRYRYDNGTIYQIDGANVIRWISRLPY